MKYIVATIISFSFLTYAYSQQNWKLSKDKDGIRIYTKEVEGSSFKKIKVECTFEGNFDRLISIITDVEKNKDWVYNTKTAYVLKKFTPLDIIYYTETIIPWPMANRDAIIHLRITKDTTQRVLKITAIGEPDLVPEKEGKVRVPRYFATWYVTIPAPKKMSIIYTFEVDPGGSLPGWVANMFTDKGPYESFRKLAQQLKQ